MREIEFRQPMFGENGEFIGFHYWGFIDGKFIGPSSAWTNGQESQQDTGFKDKNGKKIFEGDVVRFSNNPIHEGVLTECRFNQKFSQFIYVFLTGNNKGKATDMHDSWREYEVIGNIYENPELLEQSK